MTTVTFRELAGGAGCSIISATPGPDLAAHGFGENEYAAAGTATHHAWGAGTVVAVGSADYTTRILVRRPLADDDFNGTVVVEWLNVSSGADAAPEYTYLAEELIRGGYAWAGVSAQYTGIEGGEGSVDGLSTGAASGLAAKDPDRYAGLHHPGDAYCYDIFASIGSALRSPTDTDHPLSGLSVRQLLAVGESQSAMALTTYARHFVGDHDAFEGILIHSRAAAGMPFGEVGRGIDIDTVFDAEPVTIPASVGVPVLTVQTETDVLTNFMYVLSRQPDSSRIRTWEVAGTSHADLHQIGPYENLLGCPTPVNRGQQRFVLRAALRHLASWAAGGTAPPSAPPLELDNAGDARRFLLDEIGNVRGGVRSPSVDAPTQVLSGIVAGDVPRICVLFGSTTPADPEALGRSYAGAEDYLARYRAATTDMIRAGFALDDDRDEILADAHPDLVPASVDSTGSPVTGGQY